MKRPVLVLAILSLVASAGTALAAPDRTLTVEKGKLKILHLPFAPSIGANSNPGVIQATPDLERKRLIFVARDLGEATYTLFESDEKDARRLEVRIRVVEARD